MPEHDDTTDNRPETLGALAETETPAPDVRLKRERRPLPMSDEYAGFLLLNVFDLFLTGYIFRHGGEEVNPAGVWVLSHFGLAGFAVFKFLMVAFVILVIEIIYRQRAGLARKLLNGANFVYLGVILWECVLLMFRYS